MLNEFDVRNGKGCLSQHPSSLSHSDFILSEWDWEKVENIIHEVRSDYFLKHSLGYNIKLGLYTCT